jgi:acetoacetyl-CoA synthetase
MVVTDRPDILWRPSARDVEDANVTHFMRWLQRQRGITHSRWNDLWKWSVRDLDGFWSAVWD